MKTARKGDWVQISNVVLPAGSRAPQVPEDTQKCDLIMWVKGFVQSDAKEGDTVEIITTTGRHATGTLCDVNPRYVHDYGDYVPELTAVRTQLRSLVFGLGGDK